MLDVNHSLKEAIDAMVRLLGGEDRHCDQRRQFVKKFVRPHGLGIAAGEVAARAIGLIAGGKSVNEIESSLSGL